MVKEIILKKSPRKEKKWRVILSDDSKIDFGATGYSDYTKHKDPERKKRYIARHQKRENWKKSGINTAGFWSRWLLWNEPSLEKSIKSVEKKFNVKINKK